MGVRFLNGAINNKCFSSKRNLEIFGITKQVMPICPVRSKISDIACCYNHGIMIQLICDDLPGFVIRDYMLF